MTHSLSANSSCCDPEGDGLQEWNGIPGQWWFGGGTDITPSYVNEEDMRHFHGTYKVSPLLISAYSGQ